MECNQSANNPTDLVRKLKVVFAGNGLQALREQSIFLGICSSNRTSQVPGGEDQCGPFGIEFWRTAENSPVWPHVVRAMTRQQNRGCSPFGATQVSHHHHANSDSRIVDLFETARIHAKYNVSERSDLLLDRAYCHPPAVVDVEDWMEYFGLNNKE